MSHGSEQPPGGFILFPNTLSFCLPIHSRVREGRVSQPTPFPMNPFSLLQRNLHSFVFENILALESL